MSRNDTATRLPDVKHTYATPTARLVGSCILCGQRTMEGRPISPRRGLPRSFVCWECIPAGGGK